MALAIFDLDHTLIGGDSDHAWGEFLVDKGLVDAAAYRAQNDRFYADYQAGRLDIKAYQAFVLTAASRFTLDGPRGGRWTAPRRRRSLPRLTPSDL